MNDYRVESLKDGMTFTEDVFIDDDSILVPAHVAIRKKDIDRIKAWGIDFVRSEGNPVDMKQGTVQADPSDVFDNNLWGLSEDQGVVNTYINTIGQAEDILDAVKAGQEIVKGDVDTVIDEIITLVRDKKNETARMILSGAVSRRGAARSAVNTTILAVVMGMGLKRPQHKLAHLAAASLLHDSGMLRIPQAITDKKGKLTPDEMRKMRLHPLHTYKIIKNEIGYDEEIAQTALQHHERWDGGGYPRGLKGEQILLHSRILTVADAFEAMVSVRPYRNSMIGYQATKALISDNSRRFDPEVLKIFIRSMGIYPVGSIVLLNDSSIGQVIETHAQAPLRPVLEILINSSGHEYHEKKRPRCDLFDEKDLFIARAVDLNKLNT